MEDDKVDLTIVPSFKRDIFPAVMLCLISFLALHYRETIEGSVYTFVSPIFGEETIRIIGPVIHFLFLAPLVILLTTLLKTYFLRVHFDDTIISYRHLSFFFFVLPKITDDPIEYYRIKDFPVDHSLYYGLLGLCVFHMNSTDRTCPHLILRGVNRKDVNVLRSFLHARIEKSQKATGRGREVEIV